MPLALSTRHGGSWNLNEVSRIVVNVMSGGQDFGLNDRLNPVEYIMRMYFAGDLLFADIMNFGDYFLIRNSCAEFLFSKCDNLNFGRLYKYLAKRALRLRYQPRTQDLCRLLETAVQAIHPLQALADSESFYISVKYEEQH